MTTAPEQPRPTRSRTQRVITALRHPLSVTLLGALISVALVPNFSRQWQDRQKERELKQALVASMNESVTETLKTAEFLLLGLPAGTVKEEEGTFVQQRVYNEQQIKWEIQSARVGAQLRAYFSGSGLHTEWAAYSRVMTLTYQLVAGLADRPGHVNAIKKYLGVEGTSIDFDALMDEVPYPRRPGYEQYLKLQAALFVRRDELVQRVLDTGAAGFQTDPWPW